MEIISLNIGMPKEKTYKRNTYQTGIEKKPVQKVWLSKNGFEGDGVANTDFHGGVDRAVCFYVFEHYQEWEREFNRPFTLPSFGENITVSGMNEKNICIGDIFQIGETIVQITQGRIPCSTISDHNEIDPLLKRIIETCRTGYFARVLKQGYIENHSKITLVERNPFHVDIHLTIETFFHQLTEDRINKILQVNELANDMKEKFKKRLSKIQSNQ